MIRIQTNSSILPALKWNWENWCRQPRMPSVPYKRDHVHLDSTSFWLRSLRPAATGSGQSPNIRRKCCPTPRTRWPEASSRDFNPRHEGTEVAWNTRLDDCGPSGVQVFPSRRGAGQRNRVSEPFTERLTTGKRRDKLLRGAGV